MVATPDICGCDQCRVRDAALLDQWAKDIADEFIAIVNATFTAADEANPRLLIPSDKIPHSGDRQERANRL